MHVLIHEKIHVLFMRETTKNQIEKRKKWNLKYVDSLLSRQSCVAVCNDNVQHSAPSTKTLGSASEKFNISSMIERFEHKMLT